MIFINDKQVLSFFITILSSTNFFNDWTTFLMQGAPIDVADIYQNQFMYEYVSFILCIDMFHS